jgi:hypothetical protein
VGGKGLKSVKYSVSGSVVDRRALQRAPRSRIGPKYLLGAILGFVNYRIPNAPRCRSRAIPGSVKTG